MFDLVKIREGRDNFFTPLRILLALMVLAGHAVYVTTVRDSATAPVSSPTLFLGYELSYIAVNMFFILSGFLITKSMLRRNTLASFASARLLRIIPALTVYIFFVIVILGPFVTQLPWDEFFSHPGVYTQPAQVLSLFNTDVALPEAFIGNEEQVSSPQLWTLRYEAFAYIGTALLFSLGLLRRNWMVLALCILSMALWTTIHFSGIYDTLLPTFKMIIRFGLCYSLGASIYMCRDKLSFHITGLPILILIAALFRETVFFEIGLNICLAYFVFWAAYLKLPQFDFLKKSGDISYGIYIYHYCILQTVYYVHPNITALELFTLTLPITVILASMSWYIIEKPALAQKQKLANMFQVKPAPTKPIILAAE